MESGKLAIIGGGKLGSALAEGMIRAGLIAEYRIHITRRNAELLKPLADKGLITGSDNIAAVKDAGIVFLAVKPWQVEEVLGSLVDSLAPSAVIISLAAGVSLKKLQEASGDRFTVFRAIPNTAVAVCESVTAVCSVNASEGDIKLVGSLFSGLGIVEFIPEDKINAATVLASCGTAFALRYIRAAVEAGVEIGLSPETAVNMVAQTVKGAARLLLDGDAHPEAEIDKVTTPGGITIAGLNAMEHAGFSSSIIKGINAAFRKTENK